MTIRTLLIYDVPGWACYSECEAIREALFLNAPGQFNVTIAPSNAPLNLAQHDLVFSTLYYHLPPSEHPRSVSQVSSYSYWIRKGWTAEQNHETGVAGWPHLRQWKHMIAKNKDIASKLTDEDHPDVTQLYHVMSPTRWLPKHHAHVGFKVGYAGHRQGLKGLELIEQAVDRVEGATLAAPTYESGRIPHGAMADYYNSLDVYVCMSKPGQDAGPRSPIEAGMCGVPVVTTRGGQIGEMVTSGVDALVVERNVDALVHYLELLRDSADLRRSLADNAHYNFHAFARETGRQWTNYFLEIANDRR